MLQNFNTEAVSICSNSENNNISMEFCYFIYNQAIATKVKQAKNGLFEGSSLFLLISKMADIRNCSFVSRNGKR